jgi:hypothetical protein
MRATPAEVFLENLEQIWPEDALDYMPRERAYEELKRLTGQDFGYDVEKWKSWLRTHRFLR